MKPDEFEQILAALQLELRPAEIARHLGISRPYCYRHREKGLTAGAQRAVLAAAGYDSAGVHPRLKPRTGVQDLVEEFRSSLLCALLEARGSDVSHPLLCAVAQGLRGVCESGLLEREQTFVFQHQPPAACA